MEISTPLNTITDELTYNQRRALKWKDYQSAYRKEYYQRNKEKMIENALKWNKENADKQKKIHRVWLDANRDVVLEKQRQKAKAKRVGLETD
jgi:hypothetical protein